MIVMHEPVAIHLATAQHLAADKHRPGKKLMHLRASRRGFSAAQHFRMDGDKHALLQ
jgi:hypothetical protein